MTKNNDWQELKIDDCEFQVNSKLNNKNENSWSDATREEMFICLPSMDVRYRPRQPEKKEPSHEEIMTKWWEAYGNWYKVVWYSPEKKEPYYLAVGADIGTNKNNLIGYSKTWFTNRESATIPPEEE